MDQGNIDDMFSQMLGELDDLTQQLDAVSDPPSKDPPPQASTESNLFEADFIESSVTDFDEEDVDLTAMLDDLCTFEENINNTITEESFKVEQLQNAKTDHSLASIHESDTFQEENESQIKSEKVRIALEKIKEARIQKLVVKVLNKDDSSKTLMIDERMTTRDVMKHLVEKNHFDFSPNWALIEEMPALFLERMFEEDEKPCDIIRHWTRDTVNQLRFVERKDKYALFKNPQHYLLSSSDQQEQMQEQQKWTLIEEFFADKGTSTAVPEVEGYLHIKNGKSWSRKYCVLRSSGLYFSKSGEPKKGKKLSDLACLVMFEQTILYIGRGWRKRFKSPYEFGFALKHPTIQAKSKHIRYIACEDFKSLMRWTVGIRLAKYGVSLLENYEKTNEDVKSASAFLFKQDYAGSDCASLRSTDSGETGSRHNTLPRGAAVKNMFEGAWQRANKNDQNDKFSSLNRANSSIKSTRKKSGNWWELQDDSSLPLNTSVRTSPSKSLDDLVASSNEVDYSLPSPPPPLTDDEFPVPPPVDHVIHPPSLPSRGSSRRVPPTPPPKPSFDPEGITTFESYEYPLPPPPPSHDPASTTMFPKNLTHFPQSNNNSNSCLATETLPLPPPPVNVAAFQPSHVAPLTSYYMNGKKKEQEFLSKDDFPPPPPFLLDLKESINAVSESSGDRRSLDHPPPRPNRLISYIKSQTLFRLKGNKRKVPPPPPRSGKTQLSFKG